MANAEIRGCRLTFDLMEPPADGASNVPMVWAHGLTSSRSDDQQFPLIDLDRLAQHRRVLRYDARGHGSSGDLTDPAQGAWDELALDMIGLVDRVGFEQVVLAGASMGTATALHAALQLRDRVDRLVLVIPPTAWESRRAQTDNYLQMAKVVERDGLGPLIAGVATVPPPDPFVGDDRWIDKRREALGDASPERLAASFRGAAVADLPDVGALRTLDTPTLVLAWSGDPGHPVSTAERLGEVLPNCEVVISATADELATWTDRTLTFLDR